MIITRSEIFFTRLFIFLLVFTAFPVFSAERSYLFIPGPDHPFFLNSSAGGFRIDDFDKKWPRSLLLQTDGDGRNVQLTAYNLPDFGIENRHLVIWVKAENVDNIEEFWLYAADSNDFSNRVVFMVSSDKSQLKEGRWTRLSLPLSAGQEWGTPDISRLKAFQFWLRDSGAGPCSVRIGPVYLQEAQKESAIILTFDDGWKSQIDIAAPVMADLNLRGTAYIIPELIGSDKYMTEDDLKKLSGEFGWSLGGHYQYQMGDMSLEELGDELAGQRRWFASRGLREEDFSYPNGVFNRDILKAVSWFFRSGRTIIEFPETDPPGDRYMLKVLNIVPPVDYRMLQRRLDSLSPRGELLILLFHKIEEFSNYETELTVADFRKVCGMVSRSGILVRTMEEVSADFPEYELNIPEIWNQPALFQPGF